MEGRHHGVQGCLDRLRLRRRRRLRILYRVASKVYDDDNRARLLSAFTMVARPTSLNETRTRRVESSPFPLPTAPATKRPIRTRNYLFALNVIFIRSLDILEQFLALKIKTAC